MKLHLSETASQPGRIRGPIARYFGGKWRIAPWIVSHFPEHDHYTEVFAGAASVFFRKPVVRSEVLNDIDSNVVNLFRVLRNPEQSLRLSQLLELTPFSREEFDNAELSSCVDPVERARRWLVISHMRFGTGNGETSRGEGFRSSSKSTFPAVTFTKLPRIIQEATRRLAGVLVENLPATDVLLKHDTSSSLHYVDPPYIHETRTSSHKYAHEMSLGDHVELLQVLESLKGSVVVSGYAHPLYDRELANWGRRTRKTTCEKGLYREEVLWIKGETAGCSVNTDMLTELW